MEYLKIVSFFVPGLISLLSIIQKRNELRDIVIFLTTVSTSLLMLENTQSDDKNTLLSTIIISFLSLNFLISRSKRIKALRFSFIIPAVLSFIFLSAGKTDFQFNNYDFQFSQYPILLLPVIGTLILPLAELKAKFFKKFMSEEIVENLERSVVLFLVGFSVFIGSFFASNFGIFLIAIGLLSNLFYADEKYKNVGISLLFLSLIAFFMKQVNLETVDLSLGKTIEGIFIGAMSVLFISAVSKVERYRSASLIFGIVIPLFLIFGLLLLNTQKSDFGGMDAFIGVLVGIALTICIKPANFPTEMLFSFLVSGGILFSPLLINKEEEQMTVITVGDNHSEKSGVPNEKPFEIEGVALDSIIGNYSVNQETTQLNFKLGPKGGITKGAFKSFSGNVEISKNIQSSKFNIILPVSQLTTFNKSRDKSLMEPEYFNPEKFQFMTFTSESLIRKGDMYELKGTFTMLGISKPLNVNIKYLGKFDSDGQKVPVLIGQSSVDRTLFGMKPDSKEGNIVDFEFKIELISN